MQPQRVASGQNESWQVCVLCMVSAMPAIVKICLLLALMLPAAAQRFASFDAATAPSVYILVAGVVSMRPAVALSNFKLLRHPGPTLQPRSLRGIGAARGTTSRARPCPGLALSEHGDSYLASLCDGSYAPGEIKVLTSADGGNFQESVGWSKLSRSEPSFQDCLFPRATCLESFQSANARRQALGCPMQLRCRGIRLHARERRSSSPRAMPCRSWGWCGCKALHRSHCGWHRC